jgi:hypothetical protein
MLNKEPPSANINLRRTDGGEKNSLTCYNSGLPKPKIVWFYNMKNVKFQSENFMQMRNVLYIKNKSQIKGIYTCVAVGLHGKISMSSVEIQNCEKNSSKCTVEPYSDPSFTTPTKAPLTKTTTVTTETSSSSGIRSSKYSESARSSSKSEIFIIIFL